MDLNRRQFIAQVAAVASSVRSLTAAPRSLERVGLQLFTLRDAMKADSYGTLARVADIGYTEVEFAGYFAQSPRALRDALIRNRLGAPSAHVLPVSLGGEWARTVADASEVGHRYLVLSAPPPEVRDSVRLDDWKRLADTLNHAADTSRRSSIQLGYHNHHYEFATVEGRRPYDVLLEGCDPSLVVMQVDLCWMTLAGVDVRHYLKQLRGRVPMVHVKDVTKLLPVGWESARPVKRPGTLGVDVEVGAGIIDWPQVMTEAAASGVVHFFVEHESASAPFDSIRYSHAFLRRLRF